MAEINVITRARTGDEAAQRTLYERYFPAAYRLGYLLLGNPCDAEEAVQDAFVYLFRNLDRYDEKRGSFWAWLRVTVVSRSRNKRRYAPAPPLSLEQLEEKGRAPADRRSGTDPAQLLELRGAQRALWEALQQVSPGARNALILRYYADLPYAEIARMLDCSAAAARARVAHGKVQLRHLLAGQEEQLLQRSALSTAVSAVK